MSAIVAIISFPSIDGVFSAPAARTDFDSGVPIAITRAGMTRPDDQLNRKLSDPTFSFGADADKYLALYPFTTDEEAQKAQAASMRDQTFGWNMRTWARHQTKTGQSKVYLYYFSHVPSGISARMGAQHGAEIAYVFDYANNKNALTTPWTEYDKKLSDTVSSYFYNFAATGDPNGKGLPKWPAYQTKDDTAMSFGDTIETIPVPHKPALDFLDTYYEGLWKSGKMASQ